MLVPMPRKRSVKPAVPPVKRAESDLSAPVTAYLSSLGFTTRAEVKHCDITATLDDMLVVVELKTAFCLDLVLQAVERQTLADAVYVALPAGGVFGKSARFDKKRRGVETLLRRLRIGLLLVHFSDDDAPPTVECVFSPAATDPAPKPKPKRRAAVVREIAGRTGDYNIGGTTGVKRTTAYREEAIFLAACLEKYGASSASQLQVVGATTKARAMLFRNVYNWFERTQKRGVYALAPHAIAEIARDWEPALAAQRARAASFAGAWEMAKYR